MFAIIIVLAALVVAAIAATLVQFRRDGYGPLPTRLA